MTDDTSDNNRVEPVDPVLVGYQPSELQIASEFLSTWLPFLTRDLCQHCSAKLTDRVRSLGPELGGDSIPVNPDENSSDLKPESKELQVGSDNDIGEDNHEDDTSSLGWKDGAQGLSEPDPESSKSGLCPESPLLETPSPRMSWADMAQEDELEEEEEEEEEERELNKRVVNVNDTTGELRITKSSLSREQREHFRFMNVKRKKEYMCLERVNGKLVNILDGLVLHTGIFSAAEQKRIVDCVYELQEMGRKGELKARTYTAPQKWMRGKGRVTMQFGCCYNYVVDKYGNPPGILRDEVVDPIPHLFKVIIRRLVKWHVLPPTCVPDSCIVNVYDEGDCIPPHIDNHDFVRPFCTVSFLSECNIVFGSNLKIIGPGEFEGSFAIPLPVGSVLVLNGKGADVAKHCVPAVPTKRISITFRRMDETKRPNGYVPEPDLQDIQPLSFEQDKKTILNSPRSERGMRRQPIRRAGNSEIRGSADRREFHSAPRDSGWSRRGSGNRWNRGRANVNFES
ncbi:RNA demethylase ALKBH9B-like isoform X1 [Malus sylvestris]|uniref:RNA demethylase ALKBH9B-like isoform X1 n=2 Tax=Malus sylvestris TaxID=3752 RepID=UPI0021AB9BB0|nr:RNA demethylase ALKBH9B-like isoform X1 [Malus sylvestris]